jgi:hypothetical protein
MFRITSIRDLKMAQLQLEVGEAAIIKKEYKYRVPSFNGLCNGFNSLKGAMGMDPMPLLLTINPKAVTFFIKLYTLRNDVTNVVEYAPRTPAEANSIAKWYKDLVKIKLITRIKPKTYLINPHMFLPRFEFFEPVAEHWKKVNP